MDLLQDVCALVQAVLTKDDYLAYKSKAMLDDDDDDDDVGGGGGGGEDGGDDDDDDVGGEDGGDDDRDVNLSVMVESHVNCDNCKYKIMEALPSTDFVDYTFDSNDYFSAVTTKDSDKAYFRKLLFDCLGRIARVTIVHKSCPNVGEKREFDISKFMAFCDNFGSNVLASTTNGHVGELYRNSYPAVMKVIVKPPPTNKERETGYGTAFVVHRSVSFCLLLSCGHVFEDFEKGSRVQVVNSEFNLFDAELVYTSPTIDFSILVVKADVGDSVKVLRCSCDNVMFGEAVACISTPSLDMAVNDDDVAEERKHRLHSLWFPLSRGFVAHPWLVGAHPKNLGGDLMALHLQGLAHGASGAPILNSSGRAMGIFTSTLCLDDETPIQLALKLSTIKDTLVSEFRVPDRLQSNSFLWIVCYVAMKRGVSKDLLCFETL